MVLAKIEPQERPMLPEGSQTFDFVSEPAAVRVGVGSGLRPTKGYQCLGLDWSGAVKIRADSPTT